MSLLSDAACLLSMSLKQTAGETVTYSRGATDIGGIVAVPDTQSYEVMDSEGFVVTVPSYDWLFTATDLVIGEGVITPRAGDTIMGTLNGVPMTFEVMAVGTKPCVEPAEPDGILIVVHSKRVSVGA